MPPVWNLVDKVDCTALTVTAGRRSTTRLVTWRSSIAARDVFHTLPQVRRCIQTSRGAAGNAVLFENGGYRYVGR